MRIRRDVPLDAALPIELRTTDDEKPPVLSGYTAVFNSWTDIGGLFRERIAPGAFEGAIGGEDTAALFNHDPSQMLGRLRAGTLRVKEDERGLHYEVDLDMESQIGRQVARWVSRGELTGNSFAFTIGEQEWDEDDDGNLYRTITKVDRLYDVGPVTFPAYPQAKIDGVRQYSDDEVDMAIAELRDAGFEFEEVDDDDGEIEWVFEPDEALDADFTRDEQPEERPERGFGEPARALCRAEEIRVRGMLRR